MGSHGHQYGFFSQSKKELLYFSLSRQCERAVLSEECYQCLTVTLKWIDILIAGAIGTLSYEEATGNSERKIGLSVPFNPVGVGAIWPLDFHR